MYALLPQSLGPLISFRCVATYPGVERLGSLVPVGLCRATPLPRLVEALHTLPETVFGPLLMLSCGGGQVIPLSLAHVVA